MCVAFHHVSHMLSTHSTNPHIFHPRLESKLQTTRVWTGMRPNHYLAVVAKPCQGEALNIPLPRHILIIYN